jgi:putative membrane protein
MMMGGYGSYAGYGGVGYWWMGLIMMLVQILFWGGIIFLAFRLFRHLGMRQSIATSTGNNNALDILRERYARGEIDSEEFQRRKEELQK